MILMHCWYHDIYHVYLFDTFPIYDDQLLWEQFLEAEIYWEDDINAIEILRDEVLLLLDPANLFLKISF